MLKSIKKMRNMKWNRQNLHDSCLMFRGNEHWSKVEGIALSAWLSTLPGEPPPPSRFYSFPAVMASCSYAHISFRNRHFHIHAFSGHLQWELEFSWRKGFNCYKVCKIEDALIFKLIGCVLFVLCTDSVRLWFWVTWSIDLLDLSVHLILCWNIKRRI